MPSHLSKDLLDVENAHLQARLHWMFEGHEESLARVQGACAVLGIDYIECLATTMENTGADAFVARRMVAESLRAAADALYQRNTK